MISSTAYAFVIAAVVELALKDENMQKALDGKTIRKQIYVQNKLVNFVAN